MDRRRASIGRLLLAAGALMSALAACSALPSRSAFDCGTVPSAACQAATTAARASLPVPVARRPLSGATVRSIDPTDPTLCRDYGVCENVFWAAIVEITVPGPGGSENWPVAVIQRQEGDPIIAPKPFPGSSAVP